MKNWLKFRGMALLLALALAVGAPVCVLQTPVEVSAKTVKKGLKKEKGNYYFYQKGKKVKKQWKTIKKKTYYFKNNGAAAIGWNKIGRKAYYFNDNGVMAKGKKVNGVQLNKKGEASIYNNRVKLMLKVQNVLDKKTKTGQTKAQKLNVCYQYMVKSCSYMGRKVPQGNPSGWEVEYAYNMLADKKGNCYSFAAGFAMLARGCGYNAEIIVGSIQKPGESLIPHAWVEIGGKVYDPQTQQILRQEGIKVNLCGKEYSKTGNVMYALPNPPME